MKKISVSFTTKIVVLNVLFYLACSLYLDSSLMLECVALKPTNILEGKCWWTFLTYMFLHAGLFHLGVNMVSLSFLGTILEKVLDTKRYLVFYLIAGVVASIFHIVAMVLFSPVDLNVSIVGASGAIFGVVGVLGVLFPDIKVSLMFLFPINMKYAGILILSFLWVISYLTGANVGNWAHLGGYLSGLMYGVYLKRKYLV